MRAHLHQHAPDTALTGEANPSLSDLLEVSWRPNTLQAGIPVTIAPNYGQASSMQPIDGWRLHPYLNAAAGAAPRDPHIADYILTPRPPASRYEQVPAALMLATQADQLQHIAAGPVAYVPGGVASLSKEA